MELSYIVYGRLFVGIGVMLCYDWRNIIILLFLINCISCFNFKNIMFLIEVFVKCEIK